MTRHAEYLERHGQPRGDQGNRILRALDDYNTDRHARNDAVANREISGAGNVPIGNSLMIAPRCSIGSKIFLFSFG